MSQALALFPGREDRRCRYPHWRRGKPASQVQRIAATIEHPAEPVKRGVGIRSAQGLVQGRDLIIEDIATLVEAAPGGLQHLLQHSCRNYRPAIGLLFGEIAATSSTFRARRASPSAASAMARRMSVSHGHPVIKAFGRGQGPLENGHQRVVIQRLEHIDPCPRQQGAVEFERGIFSGGTDKQ